jgi:release factor glutamine methyltransferase
VAIPKPSTEALVERALPECRGTAVDVCTGSGIVAVCLAKFGRAERVIATDFSDVALETARRNATRHGAKIEFRKADLLEGISALIDLVASNPPYIAADEWDRVDPEVRFEPRAALDGGFDGMGVIRRLIEQSRERLRPGGWLFMETGYHQAAAAQRLLVGFQEVRVFRDADGVERIVGGRR